MIPVFLASDEKFAKYMAVTIESIITATQENIEFYVLDGGITSTSKSRIIQILANTNHKLEFLNVDKSHFDNFPIKRHFSLNTYFRYLIPNIKPELNKVLYIDTDMMVVGDIKEIFDTDISEYGIGAVPYIDEYYNKGMYNDYKKNLFIPETHLYFNAGMLLINCEYWRKYNIVDLLFAKTNELKDKLDAPDQDILNIVFANSYKRLDDKYNIVVDMTCTYTDIHEYVSKLSGCYILHYTGGQKMRPWMNKNVPYESVFWALASNTPFYEDLKFDLIGNQLSSIKANLPKNSNKTKTYKVMLFGFIPILKLVKKPKKTYLKIFNFINLISIKEK